MSIKKILVLTIICILVFYSKASFGTDFSNYTFKCPIYLNESVGQERIGQPVVVNISTAAGCFNGHLTNSAEIAIVTDYHNETTRAILETDNSTWVLVAFNVTSGTPYTNNFTYYAYYGDANAAPAYQKENTWLQYLSMDALPNATQPLGTSEPWVANSCAESSVSGGVLNLKDTSTTTDCYYTYNWNLLPTTNVTIQFETKAIKLPNDINSVMQVYWYDGQNSEGFSQVNGSTEFGGIQGIGLIYSQPKPAPGITYAMTIGDKFYTFRYMRVYQSNGSKRSIAYANESLNVFTERLNSTSAARDSKNLINFGDFRGFAGTYEGNWTYLWFTTTGAWDDNLYPIVGGELEVQPKITFIPPTPNNETINKNFAFVNATLNEIVNSAILEWNGTNESMQGSGTNWFINKTSLADGTSYTFKVYANETFGKTGVSEERYVVIDTTPPATITNLAETIVGGHWILWNWINPTDNDFSHVEMWLNNTFRTNISINSYNATGLIDNMVYEIQTRTVDNVGNINPTWVNDTARTLDITPPADITNLHETKITKNSINWTWTNPPNSDYNHVEVYLNGTFKANVSAPLNWYKATSLMKNKLYELEVRPVDNVTNIGNWTNDTATPK